MSQWPNSLDNTVPLVQKKFSSQITSPWLLVDSTSQQLYLINNGLFKTYTVSTSKYGLGCQQDSLKTPVGAHQIAQKIGGTNQLNEIFVARVGTGKLAEIIYEKSCSNQDLILTRILWLQGLEQGKNCGEGIDSFQRYIYIHGTQEEGLLGTPASHGCVRISNSDIVDLYAKVSVGTFVYIV